MTPTCLDKVFMTCLISYVLFLMPLTATAQRNAFHFPAPPVFQTASVNSWVYRIPTDSVYNIVFRGTSIKPTVSWMQ